MLVMNDGAFSSSERQLDALNLLLAHGASWREVDGHGQDALMRATMWGNNRLVAALISNGATVGQTNKRGFNALDIAAFNAGSCLDNQGVITELNAYVVRIFFHVMFRVLQQPDWRILQAGAIKKSPHPMIRELLAFDVVKLPQPSAVGAITITPIPFDLAGLVQTILYACRNAGDDWDRTATEKILTFAGVPMPVIELYCDYIEAFPKIRARLFGSNAANELSDAHFQQFFYGIAALTEKFDIDEHALNDAYDALGWEAIRGSMVFTSNFKILSLLVTEAKRADPLTTVFADLFDDCLAWTLSAREPQGLNHQAPPAPGLITEKLMHHGV